MKLYKLVNEADQPVLFADNPFHTIAREDVLSSTTQWKETLEVQNNIKLNWKEVVQ